MESASTPSPFVHLHVHSQYSLLQGTVRVGDLVKRAKALGQPAVAITDTHQMFGAVDFYFAAKAAGIQPILGCELHYAPGGRSAFYRPAVVGSVPTAGSLGPQNQRLNLITVLCRSFGGYQALSALLTESYQSTAFDSKQASNAGISIVDWEQIDRLGKDWVVFSGGIRGEIASLILSGDEPQALEVARKFQKRFGEDFYLEIQTTGIPEQERVNQVFSSWSQKYGFQLVGTSEVHYIDPQDAEAHEVLQCIALNRNLDVNRPASLVPPEFWLKPSQVMREQLAAYPGAYEATAAIAEKCHVEFKLKDEKGRAIYHLPDFRPDGVSKAEPFDTVAYFKEQSRLGLKERFNGPAFERWVQEPDWSSKQAEYEKRLEEELAMIERTGFSGYFLIVADFIGWAKRNGIPVGPGRGSGAGSLVAYALKITDIDPIRFALLFERFINPERISMPDFDVDFCQDRRSEVFDYVVSKYGADNVVKIITFGGLQTKAVLKDVGRVLGLSFKETNAITKLVPKELDISLEKAFEKSPDFRAAIANDPKIAAVYEYSKPLEGLYRSTGIHAAGVIITEHPVVNYCPLYVTSDGDEKAVATQFDMSFSEKIGLIKFDFLGLKTLTVIDHAVKLVRENASPGSVEENFSIERIPLDDPKVFETIARGDTVGIFQLEGDGITGLCQRFKPTVLEDVIAICALYRPGPLEGGMVDDFVDRKHGRKPIAYEVPILEPILKDTYGVVVYQEQVMQIARELAGYSLGQADLLRRAMGKKIPEEMAKHRVTFVEGAVAKGYDREKSGQIFDLLEKFAAYGFNKSHSAAYGLVSYQTAYLKTHYPVEFMAALMTTEASDTDQLAVCVSDARAHGVEVLTPDINASGRVFTVEKIASGQKCIRFGLEAIKGVGGSAVDAILEARDSGGKFGGTLDFASRVSTRKVNKKVFESLIYAGAFDSVAEANRASLLASIDPLIEHGSAQQAHREMGQVSLFDQGGDATVKLVTPASAVLKQVVDWPKLRKLTLEKQVMGIYLSGHPMDGWQRICEDWLGWNTASVRQAAEEGRFNLPEQKPGEGGGWRSRPKRVALRIAGLPVEIEERLTKDGSKMASFQLEDVRGRVACVIFPRTFAEISETWRTLIESGEPLILNAEGDVREEQAQLIVTGVGSISEAEKDRVKEVVLKLNLARVSKDQLFELKRHLVGHRGKCGVTLLFERPPYRARLELPTELKVDGSPQLVSALERLLGSQALELH